MTAIEVWLTDLVKVLTRDVPEKYDERTREYLGENDSYAILMRELEQRIACGLLQARAIECRHLAAEMVKSAGQVDLRLDPEVRRVIIQLLSSLAQQSSNRSRMLEALGLQLAQPDGWPIVVNREIMVCRCAIPHGEMEICSCGHDRSGHGYHGEPVPGACDDWIPHFVCSHCKLPRKGSAGNLPTLVTQ